jgi:hypothetical protein
MCHTFLIKRLRERKRQRHCSPLPSPPLRQRIQVPRCAGGGVDKCHFRNIVGRCPIDAAELVSVVGCLYLNFDHVMSTFSLLLDHQRSSSCLQQSAHIHINISHVSLLSLSQHHPSRLNHFRIHFMDNEFEKTN